MRTPIARAAAVTAIAFALAGCTAESQNATGTCPGNAYCVVPTTAASTSSASAPPSRRARFDAAAQKAIAKYGHPTGEQFVAAEVAAGFHRSAMQVTPDRTSANLTPGSILFSVLIDGACLVGQFGDEVGGFHSTLTRPISTGKCLVGAVPAPTG